MLNFTTFGKKTVAGVLAAFTKTITELERVEQEQREEAMRQAQIAIEANAAHEAAIKESALARDTVEAFKNLIPKTTSGFGTQALAQEAA